MKYPFVITTLLLTASLTANAGVYRAGRFAAKHSVKPAFNHALKPAAKVAAFPVRHPKKSAHGISHAGKKVAHVAKRVAD